MIYNHFIVILYHFLVLTYWHSAECQLLFFPCFNMAENQYQTESKCHKTLQRFFMDQMEDIGPWLYPAESWGGDNPPGRATRPAAPWWIVPTLGAPRTTSLLYKYPNIPKTLGRSKKYSSSHRRVQNHQIQSRHHHGGVHHFHWCLFDDVWVVPCRPSGP